MNIVCAIPARYQSTRLPGKPLMDICGKPMIWWVYQRVKKMNCFAKVICAIDDIRIKECCEQYGMEYVLTRDDHPNHISRIEEVSEKIEADYYVCVNGDEPLISEECIWPVIPKAFFSEPYFGGAMRKSVNPPEVMDPANIKLVVNNAGRCLYMSRTPIPYPKGTLDFSYMKYVGVECFNKSALEFFVNTPMSEFEKIEDIDHIRFLENGVPLHFSLVESDSLSVDTQKDLDFVRNRMSAD